MHTLTHTNARARTRTRTRTRMHACTHARKHVRKHVLPHADTAYQNKKGGICRVTALYPLPVAEKKKESEVSIEHLSWNDLNVYCQYE